MDGRDVGSEEGTLLKLAGLLEGDGEGSVESDDIGPEPGAAKKLGDGDGDLALMIPPPPDILQAPLHLFRPRDFLLGCWPCNRIAALIFLVPNWVSDLIGACSSDDPITCVSLFRQHTTRVSLLTSPSSGTLASGHHTE